MLKTENDFSQEEIQEVILGFENPADFKSRLESVEAALLPRSGIERLLAQYVAVSSWRMARLIYFETALLQMKMYEESILRSRQVPDSAPEPILDAPLACRTLAENSHCLDYLARHETRSFRNFEKALNLFLKVRNEFPAPLAPSTTPITKGLEA
jgi:hypothetical protein